MNHLDQERQRRIRANADRMFAVLEKMADMMQLEAMVHLYHDGPILSEILSVVDEVNAGIVTYKPGDEHPKTNPGAPNHLEPKGQPADAETRRARIKAHEAFDRLWRTPGERLRWNYLRTEEYQAMADELGIGHIGDCDAKQCAQVIEWAQERLLAKFHDDLEATDHAMRIDV